MLKGPPNIPYVPHVLREHPYVEPIEILLSLVAECILEAWFFYAIGEVGEARVHLEEARRRLGGADG